GEGFSRPTTACRCLPCSMERSVSWARRGSSSMLTRPSPPCVAAWTAENMSAASRTSSVVSTSTTASTSLPSPARRATSASYSERPEMADWKTEGLVVTPTTLRVSLCSRRLRELMRRRQRSSGPVDTQAAERVWVRGFWGMIAPAGRVCPVADLRGGGGPGPLGPAPGRSGAGGGQGLPGGLDDGLGREAVLLEEGVGV